MAMDFPKGFVWGTATSSFQIEGATREDGRGRSIWDDFCAIPGKIEDGSNGDVACDHYHRYKDDVKLMRSLGFGAYRFSTAWPRVLPTGRGYVNGAGIDFYSRLVDELLDKGITPFVTLYHWDLPSDLQERGGWSNRDTALYFADYAAIMARTLGDRVRHWITLNEPWCTAFLSNEIGVHAPGLKNPGLARMIAHNLMLAHGYALQALRASLPPAEAPAQCGITLNFETKLPLTNSPEDKRAAEIAIEPLGDWFVPPLLFGTYDPRLPLPENVKPGDMAVIAQRNDFIGINYYSVHRVKAGKRGVPERGHNEKAKRTLMGWEVEPKGLKLLLMNLHAATRGLTPLYITENGASYQDTVEPDGSIHDKQRVAYFKGHLAAVQQAIAAGVDVRGYFAWSLMDNFEWDRGYKQYFGIVKVDYATQKRIVKDSAKYLSQCAAANAVL
jgi:beta-glucosidase